MKRAVSVSLGSKSRDKKVVTTLLGEEVSIERIGTDGDEEKAYQLYCELDGKVDSFGVGGIDLYIHALKRDYPLYAGLKLIRDVKNTPVVDGGGLKATLEARIMQDVEKQLGDIIQPKTVLLVAGLTRGGMTRSFIDAGYQLTFGDLMFGLQIPIPIYTVPMANFAAAILLPIVGRMPIKMLYPTGEKQLEVVPKYEKYYAASKVIAGDWLYIMQHAPDDLSGKVIVTNTTTEADVTFLKDRGVDFLITTTPVLDGRSFGTNMFEAALVAAAGKNRPLTTPELDQIIDQLSLKAQIQDLR
ncbi:MAG: quinate 5-dehydrogenase [Chloroflexota bacterium]|nr:hypothetical protein [Anaerolineales bacterium]RLD02350.1 MAG: quinate 5-dehydrogenase [Chloroflexota bacterium]HDD55454.1 quinate 5-dehydrogenase [Chloroflexota bacterium]